ncbi:MAG TPA: exosortase-associated EpsI family protein [Planctomycetaceae bacterium]|nr:exosortase-associated EpsI family protein [Planctomycetaceae bacterium]
MFGQYDFPGGKRTLAAMLVGLVLLTAVPAIVQGVLTSRWRGKADLAGAAARLVEFPAQFGDWQQQGEDEKVPEEAVRELQCAGCFNRHYVNQRLGRDVTVILMVGPAGPLIRHPPEICYGNRANQLVDQPVDIELTTSDSIGHRLRLLRYANPRAVSGEFSVCYGWSEKGAWDVPAYPRVEYGAAPLLFKMQVLTTDAVPKEGGLPLATSRFLNDFLPLLRDKTLAPR